MSAAILKRRLELVQQKLAAKGFEGEVFLNAAEAYLDTDEGTDPFTAMLLELAEHNIEGDNALVIAEVIEHAIDQVFASENNDEGEDVDAAII